MYSLTQNFIYESVKFSVLRLSKGESFEIEEDINKREFRITFVNGQTCSRLKNITGFKILNEEAEIPEGTFKLRSEKLKIGSLIYMFKEGISRFSQIYNSVKETSVLDYGEMVFISINRDNIPTKEEYFNLLNKSGVIYVEGLSDDFDLFNYYNIDINRGEVKVSDNKSVTNFKSITISATDTNYSFMKHCKSHYPECEILSEFSDLTKIKNNENGYILVKFGLPNWQSGEFTTHLFNEYNNLYPTYGKYMVTHTRGFLDYITNSWEKYLSMRYDFLLMRKLFTHNKFTVNVKGLSENINAIVVFDDGIDDNVDRSPGERSVESSKLYSLKINFSIYSYIAEDFLEFPEISKIISNFRNNRSNEIESQTVLVKDSNAIVMDNPKETPPYEEWKGDVWPPYE